MTPRPSFAAARPSFNAVFAAFGALIITALIGAGLSVGVARATGLERSVASGEVNAATGAARAAARAEDAPPSRDRRGKLVAASTEQRDPTAPAAATAAVAESERITTTTTAPPPPPPPPPPLFATEEERKNAMFVTGQGWGNGDLPPHALAEVVPGCQLLAPAAPQFHALLLEAAWAGHDFRINDCYRDLYGQRATRWDWCVRGSCANAAVPGYSSHGFGLAVDIGLPDRQLLPTDEAYAWLVEHGPRFGFRQPDWAAPGGPVPEPWHWEYFGPVDRSW